MKIIISKSRRELVCLHEGAEILRAPIGLGFGADEGPKRREGDGRTPEGKYRISSKNPESKFHLALGISYPGVHDAERALEEGIIDRATCDAICADPGRPPWNTPMGGYIMLHGEKDPPAEGDWTAGCIAVKNSVMDTVFPLAAIGDEVEILP